jgi:uncharacterized membrane protein
VVEGAERRDEKESGRLEAFSDGVFAFAITLLVIDLRVPATAGRTMLAGLLGEWPTFFALVTSFLTILIMWVGHHNMFNYVRRIDTRFMFFNGFLLFFVVLTPFTTSLVADGVLTKDSGMVAAVYAGNFLMVALSWNLVWRYASAGRRLLRDRVTDPELRAMSRSFYVGPAAYAVALLAAPFTGLGSVVIVLLAAAYYAVSSLFLGDSTVAVAV